MIAPTGDRRVPGTKAQALADDMSTHPKQALAHAIRFLSIDVIVKAQEGRQGIANALGMAVARARLLLRISPTAQPGTRGNVVLALPRSGGVRGFGRDLFHP